MAGAGSKTEGRGKQGEWTPVFRLGEDASSLLLRSLTSRGNTGGSPGFFPFLMGYSRAGWASSPPRTLMEMSQGSYKVALADRVDGIWRPE